MWNYLKVSENESSIEKLLDAALDLPEEQREAFVHQEFAGDPQRKDLVLELLRQCRDEELDKVTVMSFLPKLIQQDRVEDIAATQDTSLNELEATLAPEVPAQTNTQTSIGKYRIIREIARGGMGVVFEASDDELQRAVALKMILAGQWADEDQIQRFRTEAQATAALEHPGIVRLYDSGEHDGNPYFALEYVAGISLQEEISKNPISAPKAATYAMKIASAMNVAHQLGILHRDLKPANVLLDSQGEPKITDFGLARRMETDSRMTVSGQIMGTPGYMSPEQAMGRVEDITPLSDIYSVGGILYALLTGRPPFVGETVLETLQLVREQTPIAPSQINEATPVDLETICLKCLEKDPVKRFRSGDELAKELKRYLQGIPILSRPISAKERLVRWAKRNTTVAILLGSVFLTLLIGIAGTSVTTVYAFYEKALAEKAEERAQDAQSQAEERQRFAEAHLARSVIGRNYQSLSKGHFPPADIWNQLGEDIFPVAQQSFDFHFLKRKHEVLQAQRTGGFMEGAWGLVAAAFSPDGSKSIVADSAGLVVQWDLSNGKRIREIQRGNYLADNKTWESPIALAAAQPTQWNRVFTSLVWLEKENRVLGCSLDGELALIDANGGDVHTITRLEHELWSLAVDRDGKNILLGTANGKLISFNRDSEVIREARLNQVGTTSIQWHDESESWLVGQENGEVHRISPTELNITETKTFRGPIWDLKVLRQNEKSWLAVGSQSGELEVLQWNADESQLKHSYRIRMESGGLGVTGIHQLFYRPSEGSLYLVDGHGYLRKWVFGDERLTWAQPIINGDRRLDGHRKRLPLPLRRRCCALWDVQSQIATAGEGGAIKLWELPDQDETDLHRVLPFQLAQNPQILFDQTDPRFAWAIDTSGTLSLIDTWQDAIVGQRNNVHAGGRAGLAWIPHHGTIVTVGGDNYLKFWKRQGKQIVASRRKSITHQSPLVSVAVSPKATWIAAVDQEGKLVVWRDHKQVFSERLAPAGSPLTGYLSFNTDESRLCAFGPGQTAVVYECRASDDRFSRYQEQLNVEGSGGRDLVWNPTDRHPFVLYASDSGRYFTKRAFGEEPILTEALNRTEVYSEAVALTASPDKKRIVVLERDGRVQFRETDYNLLQFELQSSLRNTSDIEIDPNCRRLLIANAAGQIEIWETESTERVANVEAENQSEQWQHRTVATTTEDHIRFERRSFCWGNDGRYQIAFVTTDPLHDFRDEGVLRYSTDLKGEPKTETISVAPCQLDSRVDARALALQLDGSNRPKMVFRRRVGDPAFYDGEILLGELNESGEWAFIQIQALGNDGFFPLLRLSTNGQVQDVLHYSFSGSYLRRSSPTGAEHWPSEIVGRQGDGFRLHGVQSDGDAVYAAHGNVPFNQPGANTPYYVQWDGEAYVRERSPGTEVRIAPDLTLILRSSHREKEILLRQGPEQWTSYLKWPANCLGIYDWVADTSGSVIIASWDTAEHRLLLWQHVDDDWTVTEVASAFPSVPDTLFLKTNASNQLCLCVARRHKANGWIQVLTKLPD